MAQEAEQKHGATTRSAAAAQQMGHDEGELRPIDQDLVDDYMDIPLVTTINDILLRYDPRHDMRGIYEGIEHGGYRRALERLLPLPPPRTLFGSRRADNRARMLERLGRHEEAERLYRDLADEEPGHSSSQLDMARVLEHMGRLEESAEALARACGLDSRAQRAFEAGMRPDPRQSDPDAVPLRLILPMSVIAASEIVRSRAELGAASLLVQAECELDLYPPSGALLPGCAGLGADMERFHHLVVEDILPHYRDTYERPYYYDLTDLGAGMIGRLGERLDGNGDVAARMAASAARMARIGPHDVLEEACAAAPLARQGARGEEGRAAELARLRGTAERIRREIGNGIAFGEVHAIPMLSKAACISDMLSQASGAPRAQWAVATALAGDVLGMCARVAFDQRPHPRTTALGRPYHEIQDLYALFVGYCRARGIAEAVDVPPDRDRTTAEDAEEMGRDMLRAISAA